MSLNLNISSVENPIAYVDDVQQLLVLLHPSQSYQIWMSSILDVISRPGNRPKIQFLFEDTNLFLNQIGLATHSSLGPRIMHVGVAAVGSSFCILLRNGTFGTVIPLYRVRDAYRLFNRKYMTHILPGVGLYQLLDFHLPS